MDWKDGGMRIPNRLSYKRWIRYEMIFFLGIIFGSLIFLLFLGKELDRLHLQVDSLENENMAYEEQLKKLKEDHDKVKNHRKLIVEDVEVHIIDPKPDGFTEAELIRLIERDTKYLEEKKLESVNDLHLYVHQHFKDRNYKIGDRLVRAELKTMTIHTTVHLYIFAKPITTTP